MRDVAARAGVGIKTVSRVINGEPNVSASTIERVRTAARQLDYQPDLHAGNLRRADGRTRTLGLLVGNVENPFSGALHRAVEEAARDRGFAVFASSLDDEAEREQESISAFLRRRVDGLILTTISRSQAYLLPEQERGTPLVFVDREPVDLVADAVVSDNAAGMAIATRHLIDHGHTRIAYLGDRLEIQTARERRRGFIEEMGRAGLDAPDEFVVAGLDDEASAASATLNLLASDHPPTALVSGQNLITIGAIRGLRARGLQGTTALVGFDDISLADMIEPGLTVIAQDPARIGAVAAERLFARLDGDDAPSERLIVPTRLIARGSGEIRARE
ncbi:LacI family DNA-binding transcriptional regulator [Rathayibacter sp. YIM 133350]|uniref:LacI family DNA-binding transcriptional regulator n=1 Tax=Rathayibacter sp. YIM 133350 TaxID=3131992 RepID=UPI00307F3DA7